MPHGSLHAFRAGLGRKVSSGARARRRWNRGERRRGRDGSETGRHGNSALHPAMSRVQVLPLSEDKPLPKDSVLMTRIITMVQFRTIMYTRTQCFFLNLKENLEVNHLCNFLKNCNFFIL